MSIKFLSGINVDNNVLFVDDVNNRVGIGTGSPSYRLHISGGSEYIEGGFGQNTNSPYTSANRLIFSSEYSDIARGPNKITLYDSAWLGGFGIHENTLAYYSGGNHTWYQASSATNATSLMTLLSNGNLGIGTTTVTFDTGSGLRIERSGASTIRLAGEGAAAEMSMTSSGYQIDSRNGYIRFITGAASGTAVERVRITAAGNVGIGTTSPEQPLVVSNGGAAGFEWVPSTGRWYRYNRSTLAYGGIYTEASEHTWSIGASEAMRLNASGNVGIGTTSPSYKLDVNGATQIQNELILSTNDAAFRLYRTTGVNYFDWSSGQDLRFSTVTSIGGAGRSTAVTFLSTGNVGIGTTSPNASLHIEKNGDQASSVKGITLSSGAAGTNKYLPAIVWSYGASGTPDFAKLEAQRGAGTGGRMLFSVANSSGTMFEAARINESGNVGIGTTAPSSKFEVYDSANSNTFTITSDGANEQFRIRRYSNTNEQLIIGFHSSDYGYIQTVEQTVAYRPLSLNPNGGNIGIGNTAPSQSLHVSGNVRVTGAYYDSSNSAGSSGQVLSSTGSGTDWVSLSEISGVDGTGTANYVAKWSDADTIANSQIFDNGTNVGINNATPKTKLDINGTIGFGSKSLNISDTFATVLTVNMNNHTGCYVKITAFGDWSSHSAVAYLGEFFLQNGASAYNEPGVIIRQVDNTNTDDVVAQIVDPAGTGTRDFEIQLKTTSASGVPFSAAIQYEVRGQYNSVS